MLRRVSPIAAIVALAAPALIGAGLTLTPAVDARAEEPDWRGALQRWRESRRSTADAPRETAEPTADAASDPPSVASDLSDGDLSEGDLSEGDLSEGDRSNGDLSATLEAWRAEANAWGEAYRAQYHPDYKIVPLERWTELNVATLEAIIERPVTAAERSALAAELAAEHVAAKGRLYRSAEIYDAALAEIASAASPGVARAVARRVLSQIYFANDPEALAETVFWRLAVAADPILAAHAESGTLLTERDARALTAFAAGDPVGWRDAAPDQAALAARWSEARQPCTRAMRALALTAALAAGSETAWPTLSDETRAAVRRFALGGPAPSDADIAAATGAPSVSAWLDRAGVHALDREEREMIAAAERATATMVGDPSATLAIMNPTISAAWARHLAKCGG